MGPAKIVQLFMVLLFIGLGIWFIANPRLMDNVSVQTHRLFGILLVLYGCFRAYRILMTSKREE